MPEVHFTVRLPDHSTRSCYSPSSVVRRHFQSGGEMPVSEFVSRSRAALEEASERVREKFGFSCTAASAQLAEIEAFCRPFPADGVIRILSI